MAAEPTDYLSMSSEEFEKVLAPEADTSISETVDESVDESVKEAIPEPASDSDPVSEEAPTDSSETEVPPESNEDASETAIDDDPIETPEDSTKELETEEKTPSDDTPAIDYEAEYKKLMAPFKANGRTIQPKSPEDALRFMQMGANYHKKMAGMKPALKALKTLENNGLLDDEKLDYLIDLYNGNPEAITKLLQDSKIDPLDVDVNTEATYTPANHSVSDQELALDSALESIKDSPTYAKTLNAIGTEWDATSRDMAANNPQIIPVINEHMKSGMYDIVMDAVNYDRSVGKLGNISDLEAYKITGDRLEKEGAFINITNSQSVDSMEKPTSKSNPVKEQKRQVQKKAAGPTKTTKATTLPADFNPLAMSDEEFAKFDPKLIGL